jgi:pyruvate dehydrogenase E1 component alpha subunit
MTSDVEPVRLVEPPSPTGGDLPADLGLYRVLGDDGLAGEAVPEGVALEAYRYMKLMRLLDARMILLQRQGRVGFYGACTGPGGDAHRHRHRHRETTTGSSRRCARAR